jgi:hypothetical protein
MTRNVELNGLGGTAPDRGGPSAEVEVGGSQVGKVRVNEGDAR